MWWEMKVLQMEVNVSQEAWEQRWRTARSSEYVREQVVVGRRVVVPICEDGGGGGVERGGGNGEGW